MKYLDKIKVPNVVSGNVSRQVLKLQKHSPHILFVGGVVGVVATTVLACKATLKVDAVLDNNQTQRDNLKLDREDGTLTEKQYNSLSNRLYFETGLNVVKLYSPSVIIGVTSIAALTGSHRILTSRNAAITAAYAVLEKGFDEYRARVVDELGEEKDLEFRYGTETSKIETKGKDGKTKKKEVTHVGPNGKSIYARIFDETNQYWQPTPEYNAIFLRAQQNYANDRLFAKRHLLLNDVYDMLGMDRTKEGCVVGWVISKDGDNFVDFGIFADGGIQLKDFFGHRPGAIVLDFNVDGVVYDKI